MQTNNNEYWIDFFEDDDAADDVADELRLKGIESGFSRPDWNTILTPWMFDEQTVNSKTFQLAQLFKLIQQLPEKLFDNDLNQFARAIGYAEPKLLDLIKQFSHVSGALYCRWDIMCNDTSWQVLEVNVGGATGGFAYDQVQQIYDQVLLEDNLDDTQYWRSPFDSIARIISEKMLELNHVKVLVVDDHAQFEQHPQVAYCAANALSARLNVEVSAIPHTALAQTCQLHNGNVIVFEVFSLRDMAQSGTESYQAYVDGLASGKIHPVINLLGDLYMSKAVLAILKQAAADNLLEIKENELIDELVPESYLINTNTLNNLMSLNKQEWLIKSAIGYGGSGVYCGWEMPLDKWQNKLQSIAIENDENAVFILQKRIRGVSENAISMTPKGIFIDSDEQKVLGMFTVQDEFAGGFVRQSLSGEGIISSVNHASLGVMRVGNSL